LDTLTRLIAPILSFTAEQLSDNYQKNKKDSIHLQKFAMLDNVWEQLAQTFGVSADAHIASRSEVMNFIVEREAQWGTLKQIRSALLKAIENLREQGIIKHSLEAKVSLYFDETMPGYDHVQDLFGQLRESGQSIESFFREYVIISQVSLKNNTGGGAQVHGGLEQSEYKGLFVLVERADGEKCPRCWNWETASHERKLCARCQKIVL
jgi:isoleucyl-tRNA synthetase